MIYYRHITPQLMVKKVHNKECLCLLKIKFALNAVLQLIHQIVVVFAQQKLKETLLLEEVVMPHLVMKYKSCFCFCFTFIF